MKFQLINEKGFFFSVSIITGLPHFSQNKEFGYTFTLQRAEEVKQQLIETGYTNISIVKY